MFECYVLFNVAKMLGDSLQKLTGKKEHVFAFITPPGRSNR